jgi:hypothetical protein
MLRNPLNTAAIDQLDKLGLTADTHKVALACALLWTYRSPTEIHRLLGLTGLKTSAGKASPSATSSKRCRTSPGGNCCSTTRPGPPPFQLPDALRAPLYRQLLETSPGNQLIQLICELDHFDPSRSRYYWGTSSIPTTIAYVRAKFFLGAPAAELANIRNQVSQYIGWDSILTQRHPARFRWPEFRTYRRRRTLAACQPGHRRHLPVLGKALPAGCRLGLCAARTAPSRVIREPAHGARRPRHAAR